MFTISAHRCVQTTTQTSTHKVYTVYRTSATAVLYCIPTCVYISSRRLCKIFCVCLRLRIKLYVYRLYCSTDTERRSLANAAAGCLVFLYRYVMFVLPVHEVTMLNTTIYVTMALGQQLLKPCSPASCSQSSDKLCYVLSAGPNKQISTPCT